MKSAIVAKSFILFDIQPLKKQHKLHTLLIALGRLKNVYTCMIDQKTPLSCVALTPNRSKSESRIGIVSRPPTWLRMKYMMFMSYTSGSIHTVSKYCFKFAGTHAYVNSLVRPAHCKFQFVDSEYYEVSL